MKKYLILLVIVVVAGLWLFMRSKRSISLIRIVKPAHEIAYERLRKLVERDLIKSEQIKQFYEEISNILRHYIEDRFDLRAPERTTEEFLMELNSDTTFPKEYLSIKAFIYSQELSGNTPRI